jgi:membrane protein DedA with SNARE-associated domain
MPQDRRPVIETLQNLLDGAGSHSAEALFLFLLTFLREDVAIVLGGLLIVEHQIPTGLVAASLLAGIVTGDCILFGLGRLAQRSMRIRRAMLRPGAERLAGWLSRHFVAAMIVARLLPGLIFPVYLACGLVGVPIRRFAPVTVLSAALYLPAMLWLVIRFGETVLSAVGYWTWIAALIALLALSILFARKPPWGVLLRVGRSGFSGLLGRVHDVVERTERSHSGMPSLRGLASRIGAAERIPPKLFYVPIALHWVWLSIRYHSLSLPALANPRIEVGGLWGESKTVYLDMVSGDARRWLARYASMQRGESDAATVLEAARALIRAAQLSYPIVAKPDIGWQGFGVRLIHSEAELLHYLTVFPAGARFMVQEAVDWDGEAGVFYVRMPGDDRGRVMLLTFRYFPHVVGDGARKVRDLILADQRAGWKAGAHLGLEGGHGGVPPETLERVPAPGEVVRLAFIGSMRVGGLYRDADDRITPALSARFDAISRSMPDFHYGRFDVRFASVDRLQQGEDFRIIEINGAGSEAIGAWDPEKTVVQVYRHLFAQQRLMFEIGAANRARGWKAPGLVSMIRAARLQNRLVKRYPPSG